MASTPTSDDVAQTLLSAFRRLEDPRREHLRLHPLHEVLFLSVVGVLCGGDGWVGVQMVCESMVPWLRQFTPLKHGVPSHDTFGRVMRLLRPGALNEVLAELAELLFDVRDGRHVAFDGKTARRSYEDGDRTTALHLVTAWASAQGVALGQVATDGKSNEQTAMLKLIELLDLRGCLVTIDAQGCQKKIAAALSAQKADYILMLKDNHPKVRQEVADFFEVLEDGRSSETYRRSESKTTDGGHGRVEERRAVVSDSIDWFADRKLWPGLKGFGMVESVRHVGEQSTLERRYYLTSLDCSAVEEFGWAARRHWAVENELHWVLDVGLREDDSRVRKDHAATNLAMLRRLVVGALRRDKTVKAGAKNKQLKAAMDPEYRGRMLRAVFAADP